MPSAPSGAETATASPPSREYVLPQTLVVKSPSGRFSVTGTNRLEVMDLMQWANALHTRLESTLKRNIPSDKRPLRIAILPVGTNETGSVSIQERYEGQYLTQWLFIAGYDTAPVALVQENLIRLLLANFMPNRRSTPSATRPDGTVPDWFISAVIHNLTAESRDRDYIQVFEAWRSGALPPLSEYLKPNGQPGAPPEPIPVSAVLLQWMLTMPDSKACLDRIWQCFRHDTPVTAEDLIPSIPGVSSATELDYAWDNWLLKQRNRVRRPGQPSAQALDQLNAQLLIYPGDSAIGLEGEAFQPLTLRDLIKQRTESWVPATASGKAIRLRLLGTGRDEGFREVVNAYGLFLDALAQRRNERVLTERLEVAEKKLNDYKNRSETPATPESNNRKETP